MANPNQRVSDIIATTIASRSRKLADNLAHNNALLFVLNKRGNVRTVSGGTHIMEEIMYDDGSPMSGSYSGYDVIDITPDSPITAAEFDFKQYARPITISGMEMLQNAGKLVVGENIEFFYVFTLHVYRAGIAQYVHQPGLVDLHIYPFGRPAHIAQQAAQLAGGMGKIAQLLNSKFVESRNTSVDCTHKGYLYERALAWQK